MKIEYEEIKSIYAEDIEYEKDGERLTANIIKTEYVPFSFEGSTKNFCLRENHEHTEDIHKEFKRKMLLEWLEELGYDTAVYFVHSETNEITKQEIKNNEYIENVEITESTTV